MTETDKQIKSLIETTLKATSKIIQQDSTITSLLESLKWTFESISQGNNCDIEQVKNHLSDVLNHNHLYFEKQTVPSQPIQPTQPIQNFQFNFQDQNQQTQFLNQQNYQNFQNHSIPNQNQTVKLENPNHNQFFNEQISTNFINPQPELNNQTQQIQNYNNQFQSTETDEYFELPPLPPLNYEIQQTNDTTIKQPNFTHTYQDQTNNNSHHSQQLDPIILPPLPKINSYKNHSKQEPLQQNSQNLEILSPETCHDSEIEIISISKNSNNKYKRSKSQNKHYSKTRCSSNSPKLRKTPKTIKTFITEHSKYKEYKEQQQQQQLQKQKSQEKKK